MSFYREGRKVGVKTVSVLAGSNAAGKFRVGFSSGDAGLVQARAAHYATPQQGAFSARVAGRALRQHEPRPGAQGQSVRLLQSELDVLHYAVPLSGVFDEGTGRALIAFRKVTGLERIPYAGRQVFERLAHGGGRVPCALPRDGRHVEANLTKQVLAEIEPGGQRADDLHDELWQALDADGDRPLHGVFEDARGRTPRAWSTPTTLSAAMRSTATPKCPPTPPATAACACRFPTRRRSIDGSRRARRSMSTTRTAAAAHRRANAGP